MWRINFRLMHSNEQHPCLFYNLIDSSATFRECRDRGRENSKQHTCARYLWKMPWMKLEPWTRASSVHFQAFQYDELHDALFWKQISHCSSRRSFDRQTQSVCWCTLLNDGHIWQDRVHLVLVGTEPRETAWNRNWATKHALHVPGTSQTLILASRLLWNMIHRHTLSERSLEDTNPLEWAIPERLRTTLYPIVEITLTETQRHKTYCPCFTVSRITIRMYH